MLRKSNYVFLWIALLVLGVGCSSNTPSALPIDDIHTHSSIEPLQPVGLLYTGHGAPVIQHVLIGSPAERAGFRFGDKVLKINGHSIMTAEEFDALIKRAPQNTTLIIKRGSKTLTAPVTLSYDRPRFGAGFEPSAVALIKQNSPAVVLIHKKEMTVFAQSSVDRSRDELRLNFILQSGSLVPSANVTGAVFEKGESKPVGTFTENIDALSSEPRVLSRKFNADPDKLKRPLLVRLDVDKDRFLFEFK